MWLTLIRHAEPAYVVDGVAWTDPSLTERGLRQARLVGERVARWNVDEIWVSSMVRARETAEPIAELAGLEPQVMDWLREIRNPPEWDGSPADEIEEFFAQSGERSVDELWDGAPGGESFRDFHQRIRGGLEERSPSGESPGPEACICGTAWTTAGWWWSPTAAPMP
jgi:broad specificity phosphatase PhoE